MLQNKKKNSEEKADSSRNSIQFHPNTLSLLLQASVVSKIGNHLSGPDTWMKGQDSLS